MPSEISIFAQIVDKVSLMDKEQQKLLWLQLNKESIYANAAKVDRGAGGKLTMDEIVKITGYVRRQKQKN